MRERWAFLRKLLGAGGLLVLPGLFPSCRQDASGEAVAAEEESAALVGFCLGSGSTRLREDVYREASAGAVKVRVLEAYGRGTVQEDQVRSLLGVPVSCLVIFPVGALTLERAREAAQRSGTPLVVVGRGARPEESAVTLSTAEYAVATGRSVAAELKEQRVARPRIAVAEDARWGKVTSGWVDGVLDGMQEVFPSLWISCRLPITPGEDGQESLRSALAESPVDVVLADEHCTETAILVLRAAPPSPPPFLVGVRLDGPDAARAADPRFRMLVFSSAGVVREALASALALRQGSSGPRTVAVAPASLPYVEERQ